MKLKLIFQVLSIAIAATFLFSCGNQSKGVFLKRKHLKGTHFNKNKIFTFNSQSPKDKEKYIGEKKIVESSTSLNRDIKNSKVFILDRDKTLHNDSLVEQESYSKLLSRNFKTQISKGKIFEVNDANDVFEDVETINRVSIYHALNGASPLNGKSFKIRNHTGDPENELLLTPFEIAVKIIGLYLLYGIYIMGLFVICLPLFFAGAIEIAAPIIILGAFVGFIYFIYRVLRLFRNEDGKEIWSLKKTFLIVGLSLLGVYVYALYAIAQII